MVTDLATPSSTAGVTGTTDVGPIRVGFILHAMQVAGAEVLVTETIRRLGPRLTPTVFCLDSLGQLGHELRGQGVDVVVMDRRPGVDLRLAGVLAGAVRSRGIDVLHAHQYTPFFYAALAKARLRGRVRLILTEHGRHYPDVVSPMRRRVNHHVLSRLADRVNAVCAFSAEALATNDGFGRHEIEVIPNGIDLAEHDAALSRERACERAGLAPERRYITTIARFHPVKDHDTLVRGFAAVANRFADVDLLFAGEGPLRQAIEALVAHLDLSHRVRFLGVRRDVPTLLRASSAFSLTSVSEAASITILEAMASGVPTVVTNVGGNPELIRHETDGLLVPRGDAVAVAGALTRVLEDPMLADRLGRSAASRVRASFSLDGTIERYLELYRELGTSRAR